jgi:hypothetical protein
MNLQQKDSDPWQLMSLELHLGAASLECHTFHGSPVLLLPLPQTPNWTQQGPVASCWSPASSIPAVQLAGSTSPQIPLSLGKSSFLLGLAHSLPACQVPRMRLEGPRASPPTLDRGDHGTDCSGQELSLDADSSN